MTLLVLLTACGAWIGFANPFYQLPPAALLLPLGLTVIAARAKSAGQAMKTGWIAGTLAATGCLYWIYIPVQHYGNLPWYLALPCPLLLASALGVYYSLFTLLMQRACRRFPLALVPLCAGILWAGMEWCMGHLLTGFPWLTLASAGAPWPWAVQGAAFVGAYGLSGIFAALAAGLALCQRSLPALLPTLLLSAAVGLSGWQHMNPAASQGPAVHVGLIQGNIDQSLKWDPEYQVATVETYTRLSAHALEPGRLDLLIWPETAMPFYFQEPSPLRERITSFVRSHGTALLAGAPAYAPATPPAQPQLLNRAYFLGPDGKEAAHYDKEHLVPFGEYVPLGKWLPLGKLVDSVGDFSSGRNEQALTSGGIALGTLVCYEGIFPELAQRRVEQGANLLVSISNDAWFGDSSAPWQHLQLTVLRAVEQGRWLARATNTGVSLLIDPLGRIAARSGLFTEAAVRGEARLESGTTIFHRTFKVQTWILTGAAALVALICLLAPAPAETRHRLRGRN